MKEITGINHIGLRVRDMNVAKDFYAQLGFKFLVGPVGPEPVAIIEHDSGVNINLILNASQDASDVNILMDVETKHTGYTHVAIEVTDATAAEAKIEALGIEVTERVEYGGARFFFIRDPDGNVLEFHQPVSN